MQGGGHDGVGELVRRAARLGAAADAAGVRPAHRHLHRVRRGAERAARRTQGVRQQHNSLEAELHGGSEPEPVRLGPHEQLHVGDDRPAQEQVVRVRIDSGRVRRCFQFPAPSPDSSCTCPLQDSRH